MTKPIKPLDAILPLIAEAVSEWQAEHSPEVIKAKIKKLLDTNSKEVVLKLLGFNNNWDKWELDHCNGRSGESAAGDFIRKYQSEAIKEWLQTVCLPELDNKTKAQFKKDTQDEYRSCMYSKLRELARQRANEDLKLLIDELASTDQLDAYIKTMKLLNPSGECRNAC